MGSPKNPTNAQVAELETEGKLKPALVRQKLKVDSGKASINTPIRRQGVMLLKLEW